VNRINKENDNKVADVFDFSTVLIPITLLSLGIGITVGFMTIRTNIQNARDANKKAAEDRISQAEKTIITHVDNKINTIETQLKNRIEQLIELRAAVEEMERQIVNLEKKAVAYDLKVPELERMKEEFIRLKRIVENKLFRIQEDERG
jgi:predicted RNase H-like nuclease (RuvC/YqgF family)